MALRRAGAEPGAEVAEDAAVHWHVRSRVVEDAAVLSPAPSMEGAAALSPAPSNGGCGGAESGAVSWRARRF
ncbi:hypothetical protein NL676_012908 [Syzygium grande]|nr:hypothetical protein NL676_012908 [Syzygium grande]